LPHSRLNINRFIPINMKKDKIINDGTPLNYIYRTNCGYVSTLTENIGEQAVRQLEAMGYIENAFNEEGDTWQITERAKQRARKIYRSSTPWEKLKDWFYVYICRINFGF